MGGRIDNAAHVGGLIAGAWLGLTIAPRIMARRGPTQENAGPSSLLRVAAVGVVVAVIAAAIAIPPLWA